MSGTPVALLVKADALASIVNLGPTDYPKLRGPETGPREFVNLDVVETLFSLISGRNSAFLLITDVGNKL